MYIRTKDGVYEVKVNKYHELVYKKDNQIILSKDILKQSNTIEELIDGYIFVSKSGKIHYVYFKSYDMGVCLGSRIENDEEFKNHLLENGTIYGAIWNDKGLIYVAKMNDKGELELI